MSNNFFRWIMLVLFFSSVGISGMPYQSRKTLLESLASQRRRQQWSELGYWRNEFYTVFKYAAISGLGYEEGVTRRDPSSIIKVGDSNR